MRPYARLVLALALLSPLRASAQPAPKPVVAVASASATQPALAVGFDAAGTLRARVCGAGACDLSGSEEIPLPAEARARRANARLSVVRLAADRRLIVVELPAADGATAYHTVLAAPVGGGKPLTIFSGATGFTQGEWGERRGARVEISDARADGSRSVLVGEEREDIALCGRPTILAPKLVSPRDLSLKPAKVQRLSPGERAAAPRLTAERSTESAARLPLLRAVGASSGVGRPDALTDGDPETTWAENRGGDGKGELVVFRTPPGLPITGLTFTPRPERAAPERGVAPRELWVVSRDALRLVTLPEDGWKNPGARYAVRFDPPLTGGCLALVIESAWNAGMQGRVTLAEVEARTEVDVGDVDALVGALAGGGQRAEAAGSALALLGQPAFEAVARAFGALDEGGRRVALSVIDHAPCAVSAPVYVQALVGPHRAQRLHARDRLRRCPEQDGGPLLARALADAPPARVAPLADELSLIAPARAVSALLSRLAKSDRATRRALRVALARATRSPSARPEVERLLRDERLGTVAAIDLLRALGERVVDFRDAASATAQRLLGGAPSFRTRYLLLSPLGELAEHDAAARAALARAITADESAHVRARAAEVVKRPSAFARELSAALADPAVRVREAAAGVVARRDANFATTALIERLQKDRWPLVRRAAADALARHGPSATVDAALAAALADASPHVRAPVIAALGERGALAHAPALRERLKREDEVPEVRAAAAAALGKMCDREATDLLTEHAETLADPMLSLERRAVAIMALGALSRLHPADLEARLADLRKPSAPITARAAAEAALRSPGRCGSRR